MGDFSGFERGQITAARLAGEVYSEKQFIRLCRHTRIIWRQHQRRGRVGKNQHCQKETIVHWEGLFRKITQVTAEQNIHLEDSVSTKTVRRDLDKSNIHGRAAMAKPLITESNAQMRKRWCHDQKTWTSDNWKLVIWSDESSLTLFHISGRF
jgi:hypothetical protein